MNNEEYILQRLSELTGMGIVTVKLMAYATLTAAMLLIAVLGQQNGWWGNH